MKIREFLYRNPLYDVFDLENLKINGKYDEKALQMLDKSIHGQYTKMWAA